MQGMGKPAQDYFFLKIFWLQSGSLGYSNKHAGTDLFVIMKCENIIWPPRT